MINAHNGMTTQPSPSSIVRPHHDCTCRRTVVQARVYIFVALLLAFRYMNIVVWIGVYVIVGRGFLQFAMMLDWQCKEREPFDC
jgi:hypothetical protein